MISTDWGGGLLQLYRDLMLVPKSGALREEL
jgi:hypothetical protein